MFPQGKIKCNLVEGSKTKVVYMQITAEGNIHKCGIYESESSKKPKMEVIIQQSIAQWHTYDVLGRTIVLAAPNETLLLSFANAEEAGQYFKLFNSRSDIYRDQQSIFQIDQDLGKIWPFPQHDM